MVRPFHHFLTVLGTILSLFLMRSAFDRDMAVAWAAAAVLTCAALKVLTWRLDWRLSDNTVVFLSVLWPMPVALCLFLFRTQEAAKRERIVREVMDS